MRDRLRSRFGCPGSIPARAPIGPLVKSLISSRTRDAVSAGAYRRLVAAYPAWLGMARAAPADVEAVIGEVTFADQKARHLGGALAAIAACHPDFDLTFLGGLSVPRALAWLERLPGVGRKVSASTLNFSTLRMPALVLDSHVLRWWAGSVSSAARQARRRPMTGRWGCCPAGVRPILRNSMS